jgi:glucose/arabinose dehydrogenase
VVEQGGTIRTVEGSAPGLVPFLDISARVLSGGERGLLSIAFHPRYAQNGRFFVQYTASPAGQVRISEFRVPDPAAGAADPGSERVLVAIDHSTFPNHDGGQLAFGPDGLLYAGVGDGGGEGDPSGNAQATSSLLGKILRLDPDAAATPAPGNPFGNAVYHFGLRNPWRFSFDRVTGDLYVGDVGQDRWEEVDFAASPGGGAAPPAGTNWGWNTLEGLHCFSPPTGCDATGKTPPIVEYSHAEGFAVTGGFVYRGSAMPDLAATGTYFYADFGGFVRTLRVVAGAATDQRDVSAEFSGAGNLSSLGEDGCGELYVVSYSTGSILELVPSP